MATLKFETEAREEVPAVTAQEMRELDRIAVEETGPNLWQMMENAGRSLAEFLIRQAGADWRAARLLALCGSGGNGGGGYCAARHLLNHGARIRVYSTAVGDLGDVPARQRALFLAAGGEEIADDALTGEEPTLIIDAMIGYGLEHAPRGRVRDTITWANATGVPLVALDVPSGVDATTGAVPDIAIAATTTFTLALPKTGLGTGHVGALVLADLGIPASVVRRVRNDYVSPFGSRWWIDLRASQS